jgi:hypothetical protein
MRTPRRSILCVALRVNDLDVFPAERDRATSAKELVLDVGSETFGVRRPLAG